MRIIAGTHRGKKIILPDLGATRPTTDKVRGAVFNILEHRHLENGFTDISVLDAFAGSGALGLEALSRGASSALFTEQHRNVYSVLSQNVRALFPHAHTLCADATTYTFKQKFDLVFMDPPFNDVALYKKLIHNLLQNDCLNPGAIIYAEMQKTQNIDIPLQLIDERLYGNIKVQFFGTSAKQ